MFANHPEMAREWAAETADMAALPAKVTSRGRKRRTDDEKQADSTLPADLVAQADAVQVPESLQLKLAALTAPTAAQVNSLTALTQQQAQTPPAAPGAVSGLPGALQPSLQSPAPVTSPKGMIPPAFKRQGLFRQPQGKGIMAMGTGSLMAKRGSDARSLTSLPYLHREAAAAARTGMLKSPGRLQNANIWRQSPWQAKLQRLEARREIPEEKLADDLAGLPDVVEQPLREASGLLGATGKRRMALGAGTLYGGTGGLAVGGGVGGLLATLLANHLKLDTQARAGLIGGGIGAGGAAGGIGGGALGYQLIDKVLRKRQRDDQEKVAAPPDLRDYQPMHVTQPEQTGYVDDNLYQSRQPKGLGHYLGMPGRAIGTLAGTAYGESQEALRNLFRVSGTARRIESPGVRPGLWRLLGSDPIVMDPTRAKDMQAYRDYYRQSTWDDQPASVAKPTPTTGTATPAAKPLNRQPLTSTGPTNYRSPFTGGGGVAFPRPQVARPARTSGAAGNVARITRSQSLPAVPAPRPASAAVGRQGVSGSLGAGANLGRPQIGGA